MFNRLKYIFYLLCILQATPVKSQEVIINEISKLHQSIAGTKISLVPPPGFSLSSNFLGLEEREKGSSIMIISMPAEFSKIAGGLTPENLAKQGVEVLKMEKFRINDLPALLITGSQRAYGSLFTKITLCFGNSKETIMVNGACLAGDRQAENSIRQSIMSCVYDSSKSINPLEIVDFNIDLSTSGLKFAKGISGSLVWTSDGLLPTEAADKTSFTVVKSLRTFAIEDKRSFILARLNQLPLSITSNQEPKPILVDGIPGYEIYAKYNDKTTKGEALLYLAILFRNDHYYILTGTTALMDVAILEKFKKATSTFYLKK